MRGRYARNYKDQGLETTRASVYKDVVTAVAGGVVGYTVSIGRKKGSVWWTDFIKEIIQGKKRTYKEMLLRNVGEEIQERRRTESS